MKVQELSMINEFDFIGLEVIISDLTPDEKSSIVDEFVNLCNFVRSFKNV